MKTLLFTITTALSTLLLYSQIALSQQDYQELRIISTESAKHIFLYTKVVDEKRLEEIGASYQSKFSQNIVMVYFCDSKEKAPRKIPSPLKASEWEHVSFMYTSNPFTNAKGLIDERPLTAEQKKIGPPFQGKTDLEKEFARQFYQTNKKKGVVSINVYKHFMDITVDKETSKQLLTHRVQTKKLLSSWYEDFKDFRKRNGQDFLFLYLRILSGGDEIIVVDEQGIKFY